MRNILEQLLGRADLTLAAAHEIMGHIMSGEFSHEQVAGFLVALRAKGETPDEIAGFAQAMREKMVKVPISVDAIDMCGTGGDAKGTFNISTAAAFVVAGAGVPVAKHGNRSITSKAGSADVLKALGVAIALPPEKIGQAIDTIGIGFMFAPEHHPAMKHVMPARKALAIRTVFNVLGPLCNPAGVQRQVMGIFDGNLTETLAEVFRQLHGKQALLVHGEDGLDELTTTAPTRTAQLQEDGTVTTGKIDAHKLGLAVASLDDLQGGTAEENARIIHDIFQGQTGPKRDIVVLNAAAGLLVGGKAKDFEEGLALANAAIDNGSALKTLAALTGF